MNDYGKRYLIEQMNRHDERRGGGRGRDNRDYEDRRDYEDNRDYEDSIDYYDRMDSKRGVRGSGRDYENYRMSDIKLTKADINHWKHGMENTDGTKGEHYDMQQVMHAAEKLGIRFKDYDEREFCLAVNMIYSDYGHIIKRFAQDKDKELLICADFAKAYLEDPDGPEASEKLAIHYHCLTNLG